MKRIIITLLLAGIPSWIAAQEKWTLDMCIEYALEHNIELKRQANSIHARQGELSRKKAALLPSLNLTVGQDWNWGRSVDMQELVIVHNKLTKATVFSASSSLDLFNGLSKNYERLAAAKALDAARQDARRLEESLRIEVTRAYLQLMLARQMMLYARENYSTIVKQKERTGQLVEAGSQPKSSLHEMEAQVAADRSSAVDAECAVRNAALSLMQLMNLPYDPGFETGEAFAEDAAKERIRLITPAQIEDYASQDPRMAGARFRAEEKRNMLAAAKGTLLPSIRLTAGYGTYYSSSSDEKFAEQLKENRNPSLSLSLMVPVFNGLQSATAIRSSRDELKLAQLEVERVNKEIAEEIRSCVIETENCRQKYLSSEESVLAMKSLLDITEAKYLLGATTALDYLIARNNHFKAVSEFLKAKWQYLFQIKLLEHYRL